MGVGGDIKDAGHWYWNKLGPGAVWNKLSGGNKTPDPSVGWMQSPNVSSALGTINTGIEGAQGRLAPSIDPYFRNAQVQQMGQLQGIASGQQQGAGELAVQRQMQNALAAQQANARMARGGGLGMAMRNSAGQSAALGLSGAGMGQQAALQDQSAAQGLMAQLGAQGRAGDLGVGQMQQQQQQLNDQYQLALLSQQTGLSIAELQARAQWAAAQAGKPSTMGSVMQAAGPVIAGAAMSDERLKTDISEGSNDIDEMLDALVAKRYRYKDQKHGAGSRVGIMAQDMERSKAGRDVVRELPEGKALDINAALSAALASSARLNARLRKLEAKKAA